MVSLASWCMISRIMRQAAEQPSGLEWMLMGFSAAPAFSLRCTSILPSGKEGLESPSFNARLNKQPARLFRYGRNMRPFVVPMSHFIWLVFPEDVCERVVSYWGRRRSKVATYLLPVCLVMLRMVAPSLPMMAPTYCVGTSSLRGMSACGGLQGIPELGEPPCGPLRGP